MIRKIDKEILSSIIFFKAINTLSVELSKHIVTFLTLLGCVYLEMKQGAVTDLRVGCPTPPPPLSYTF